MKSKDNGSVVVNPISIGQKGVEEMEVEVTPRTKNVSPVRQHAKIRVGLEDEQEDDMPNRLIHAKKSLKSNSVMEVTASAPQQYQLGNKN